MRRGPDEAGYRPEPKEASKTHEYDRFQVSNLSDETQSPVKNTSTEQQNGGDGHHAPRFSFESESNRSEGYTAQKTGVKGSDHQDAEKGSAQVPQTFLQDDTHDDDEDAPDEPPPPFPEPEADYLEDKKEEAEDAPPYGAATPSHPDARQGLSISTAQHPPTSEPLQGPPVHQSIQPSPSMQDDRPRRHSPLQSPYTSSSSSTDKSDVKAHRFYSSYKLQGPPSQPRQEPRREQAVRSPDMHRSPTGTDPQLPPSLAPGPASLPAGNVSGSEHARLPLGHETSATSSSFRRRRTHSDSLGSGDSMVANAAASRLDLRAEPSPLNQHTEPTPPSTQPLKSKIKKIGKLHRMSAPGGTVGSSTEGKKTTFSLISVCLPSASAFFYHSR